MSRKILLIEPDYKNKYPPMGLMKLATYYRNRGDDVRFFKGNLKDFAASLLCEEYLSKQDPSMAKYIAKFTEHIRTGRIALLDSIPDFQGSEAHMQIKEYRQRYSAEQFVKFDFVCVTTLFTFYWKKTIETINFAKKFCATPASIMVGGIASSILPDLVFRETGIHPHVGLLNTPGELDAGDPTIIDELPLDYSILEEIDHKYSASNAYFAYMTRGCPRNCAFCAVPRLEPEYKSYISLKEHLEKADSRFGKQKDLLLMDNNVFASECFDKIIDEIKECGFEKGATYIPPSEYDIALENLQAGFNPRAYIKKMITLYDRILDRLPETEQGDFFLKREANGLLHAATATVESVISFDAIASPLYARLFKRGKTTRYVDFNQGVDARLVTEEKMARLAEVNIRPLRIAFDHFSMRDIYENAVRMAAKYGIRDLSNYLLYNFQDKPEELYHRMKLNVELCEELGVTIYSFPMKYHPIDDPEYFNNRDYIGSHWNRKFIRAIQAVLNATKGKIGRGKSFFEEAFGRDVEEFRKILWMPEAFIIYRRKYDATLRARLADRYQSQYSEESDLANEWWEAFNSLDESRSKTAKQIVAQNQFTDEICDLEDAKIRAVLTYYKVRRERN